MPDISVIIVNYNGRAWLTECLQSLARQAEHAEIILVDNASTDGSVEIVRSRFPGVRVVELRKNAGFAAGNNAGARVAQGRLLAFLNNDTRVHDGWLQALVNAFTAPNVGLATSRLVLMSDPEVIDSAGDGYLLAGGGFKRHHGGRASDPIARTPGEVFGACGAAFMIRRHVFEELNGFDEDFFMVYEDVDLSYRARLAGYRCVYVPEAVVEHAGSGSLGVESGMSVFFGQRNLEWVYIKNTPLGLLLRSLPAHLIYDTASAAYFARRGRLGAFARGKIAALLSLPRVLAKRRRVQRVRRASVPQLAALMNRDWLRIKRTEKQVIASRADRGARPVQ